MVQDPVLLQAPQGYWDQVLCGHLELVISIPGFVKGRVA